MNEQAHEEALSVIKEIEANPAATQQAVSNKLGISPGKTNYILKELRIFKGKCRKIIDVDVVISYLPPVCLRYQFSHLQERNKASL